MSKISTRSAKNPSSVAQKKPYIKPKLIEYGSVAEITLVHRGGPVFDGGDQPFHKVES